ncbi:MAG: hypothetical protein Q7U64_06155 [Desulfocapsaceae bacterium]|nr:hypothetical protein [Desulfocapsaceae bacterium]
MKEDFEQRISELVLEGKTLVDTLRKSRSGFEYYVPNARTVEYQKWLGSTVNLLKLIDQPYGIFVTESTRLFNENTTSSIMSHVVQKMYGILTSAQDEWQRGFLRKVEFIVIADAYDDFLDHASIYHKGNKKIESAVLASTVLEDTIKKIAQKHNVDSKGKSLEPLIDELVKEGIITQVKGKRIKGFAGVRNHALHAEWDEFDIKDVGQLISGVRELIENFL